MNDWDADHKWRCRQHDEHEAKRRRALIDNAVAKAKARRKPKSAPTRQTAAQIVEKFACRLEFERSAFVTGVLGACEAGIESPSLLELQIHGLITSETELEIVSQLRSFPLADQIVLSINSKGGMTSCSESIFCALSQHSAKSKTAIVEEVCGSAAILTLLACPTRLSRPGATFAPHKTWADGEADATARRAICEAGDAIELACAKASGVDIRAFVAARDSGTTLDASAALDMHLIHEIVDEVDIALLGIDLPASYTVQATDGSFIQIQLDRRRVGGMLLAMRKPGCEMILGLPSAYMALASRLAFGGGR